MAFQGWNALNLEYFNIFSVEGLKLRIKFRDSEVLRIISGLFFNIYKNE